jgi:hypothetical protein
MSLASRPPRHAKLPIKRLRCGTCGEPPQQLVEVGSISMTFDDVSADGRYRDAEGVQRAGDVERLYAVCAQGHRWRVRGAVQVTSVDVGAEEEGGL